jgi:hypothetical protein
MPSRRSRSFLKKFVDTTGSRRQRSTSAICLRRRALSAMPRSGRRKGTPKRKASVIRRRSSPPSSAHAMLVVGASLAPSASSASA